MWSRELRELTREHLTQRTFGVGLDGVAFKHDDGAAGVMSIADAVNGTWHIRDRKTDRVSRYGTVEDLIADGWVLD